MGGRSGVGGRGGRRHTSRCRPSSRSSRGWVGVHRPRRCTGRLGRLALGRTGLFLSADRVPGDHRARPSHPAALARAADATDGAPTRGAGIRLVQLDLAQPGVTIVRQPPVTDPIDLVLSVVGDPVVRARAGSVLVLVPSSGWAERLTARPGAPGLPDGRNLGAGAGGLAGRCRQPGRCLGSRAAAGGGRRPRCARRRLSGGECADLQRGGRRARASPPRGAPCILATPVPPVALAGRAGLRTIAPCAG